MADSFVWLRLISKASILFLLNTIKIISKLFSHISLGKNVSGVKMPQQMDSCNVYLNNNKKVFFCTN